MATPNRSEIIQRTYKVLKKHYKPITCVGDRSLLEHLLYALCLENATHEKADEGFARIQESYFDWNEVRVTTVGELAEQLAGLPNPAAAATHLKQTLQSVFEALYDFSLESLKKQNLGKAAAQLEKHRGTTPFAIAYVTQHALGGHAIPLCQGSLEVLRIVGAISDTEAEKGIAPGLERVIPKNKGVEFGSLLHQLGADLIASPFGPKAKAILLEIAPDCRTRLPKRAARPPAAGAASTTAGAAPEATAAARPAGKAADKAAPPAAAKAKKAGDKVEEKKADKKDQKPEGRKEKAAPTAMPPQKPTTGPRPPALPPRKKPIGGIHGKLPPKKDRSPAKQLAKRKPR
jgi:endonuclease-3